MSQNFPTSEIATIHADLALDLKVIALVILFGGYFTDEYPERDFFASVLLDWAAEHPFQLTRDCEPVTSAALIYMIASRLNEQSTLELPLRFFESIDIMGINHLSPDVTIRCSLIDNAIANEQWAARYGPPLAWLDIHSMLPALIQYQDAYPSEPWADDFRRTMQLVALQILILLAFRDVRIRHVMRQFNNEIEHEKQFVRSERHRKITNLVVAAARQGASAEMLNRFHQKIIDYLNVQNWPSSSQR